MGRKGRDFFRRRGCELAGEYIGLTGKGRVDFSEALEVARDVIKRFTEDEGIDKAFIIYNEFKSVMQQRVVTEQLLPVARQQLDGRTPHPRQAVTSSTTFTNNLRRKSSQDCFRVWSKRKSFAPCWNQLLPNKAPA